jgi:transcriptional regulator with XRE-family HTH domain
MAKSKLHKQEKMNLDEVIGRNIRNERQSRDVSREELAEMLELTTSHMGLIERGERGATAVTLSKLAKVLQMPVDNFFIMPPALALREDRNNGRNAAHKKIASLTVNMTDAELAFIIHVIQGMLKIAVTVKDED